jgi:hypothetical protein
MPRKLIFDKPMTGSERQRRYWAKKRERERAAFAATPRVVDWCGVELLRCDLVIDESRGETSGGHADFRGF